MEEKKKRRAGAILDVAVTFVAVFILCFAARYFIRFPVVHGESMLPTYHDGDTLVVLYTHEVSRNDTVVSWSDALGEYVVKRVIGIPGDRVEMKAGALYRNGQRLYEGYVNEQDWFSSEGFEAVVGEGEYFLMGDNRNYSIDSREIGMLSKSDIFGRVLFCLPKEK